MAPTQHAKVVDHHIGIALRRYNTRLSCPVWHLQNSCFRQSSWRYWRESTLARRRRLNPPVVVGVFLTPCVFYFIFAVVVLYNYRRAYFWHLVRSVLSFCRALSCIIIDAYISDTLCRLATKSTWSFALFLFYLCIHFWHVQNAVSVIGLRFGLTCGLITYDFLVLRVFFSRVAFTTVTCETSSLCAEVLPLTFHLFVLTCYL